MAHDKLLEYLKIMIDMETHLYTQGLIRTQLSQCIDHLAIRIPHAKPSPPTMQRRQNTLWAFFLLIVLSAGILLGCIFFLSKGLLRTSAIQNGISLLLYYIALPLLLICALAIVIKILSSIVSTMEYNRVVDGFWDTYQEQLEDYELSLQYEKDRLAQEQLQKDYYLQELSAIERIYTNTRSRLEQFYQLELIYPKYHSLAMLSCLYDCFASGLCTELTGLNGAYRFLETELQFGRIPATMDEAASFPDELRERLYGLYHALDLADKQAEALISSIQAQASISPQSGICSATTEYEMARTKTETEFEEKIKYISLWRIKK